ncbi:MAG: hypothetical protein II747_01485, partial [Clostridia bacterium]|nr:hypothetical protein [Clostridia bacterium]
KRAVMLATAAQVMTALRHSDVFRSLAEGKHHARSAHHVERHITFRAIGTHRSKKAPFVGRQKVLFCWWSLPDSNR